MNELEGSAPDSIAYVEVDTPWFSREWLLDHPDFPLSPNA